ncbi:unnamed protein product [Rotaria sordida]|uniref:Cap-specific mRNA (nucleoside-2'-O-)-methyltransferase n=1 Tax=Rotaria sordida TaxID=392033 RepID=A0A814QN37_9BILA|nr:unnamed protein product [Rotaria sordida]
MQNLNKELEKILKERNSESTIIEQLDDLIKRYGVMEIEAWRNMSNGTNNTLLHELVDRHYLDAIQYIVSKFNLKVLIKRETDNITPFELAHLLQDWRMCNLLLELGDDKTSTNTYDQYVMKKQKDKMMNIVWMDLEFTSFDNPEILECAVIITDKDLNELERKEWIVHFEKEVLDGLSEWHQNAFKDRNDGGNGLFTDVIASNITKEQMEQELLDVLKRHCPEKACPLAGSSIHIDREVMKTQMPTVHSYLHYRVIDVSSFREMMKRWAPSTASKFVREIAANGKVAVSHRAMDDIEWSIELMKMFRPLLTAQKSTTNDSSADNRNRGKSERSIIQKNKLPIIVSNIDQSKLYGDEKHLRKRLIHEQEFNVYSLKLNNNDQCLYDQNPHLREVFINGKELLIYHEEFTDKNRLLNLSPNGSTIKKSSPGESTTTEYWGQRKLLLSEIEFLTSYATDDNSLVIYAGAAPGAHLDYLSSLFPELEFVLIDIKPFKIWQNHFRIQKNKLPIIVSNIDQSKLYGDEKHLRKRLIHEQEFNVYSLKLNNNDQCLYDQNPHLREVFINGKELLIYHEEFTDKNRLLNLSPNGSAIKKSNPRESTTTEYWGQRKLLLSEIEFLTSYATDDNSLVVYAGAAPGAHLDYLSSLFPELEFVLIDIKPFVEFKSDKIKIQSERFTEDLAKTFSGKNKNILFICDIRTFSGHNNFEEDIHVDISNQMIWHSTIDSHASLLTFRLPNVPGTVLFFEGHMLLDIWTSRKSMECRLIVEKNAQIITYDNEDFERAMDNFQNVTRTMYYKHDLDTVKTEGLDHCYDCRAEIFILQKYLNKMKTFTDERELNKETAKLSYDISRNICEKNRQSIINGVRTLNVIPKK